MTKANKGKPGGPLIEPESFWSDAEDEETSQEVSGEVTQEVTAPGYPDQIIPGPDSEDSEDDITIVVPAGTMPPGQPSKLPPPPTGRPVQAMRASPLAQDDQTGQAISLRPKPGTGEPVPAAQAPKVRPTPPVKSPVSRPAPPLQAPVARPARKPAAYRPDSLGSVSDENAGPMGDVGLIDDSRSQIFKMVLAVLGVAAISAFLGWFLIGRHSNEELVEAETDPVQAQQEAKDHKAQGQGSKNAALAGSPDLVAPAQKDRTAAISISSDPAEAAVFVDGEPRGVTPTVVSDLDPAGEVEIRVEKKGYKAWEQTIELDEKDLEREINAGLVKISECKGGTGYLYISTKPPGATVEINGKRMPGKTPKVINDVCANISLEVHIQAAGRRAWKERVVVEPNEIKNLNIDMVK